MSGYPKLWTKNSVSVPCVSPFGIYHLSTLFFLSFFFLLKSFDSIVVVVVVVIVWIYELSILFL